ncbi:allene oxide synthase-lipoxygenase protein-like isoform X2 [Branchiostoma floridae x Branchiostoma belcheri]
MTTQWEAEGRGHRWINYAYRIYKQEVGQEEFRQKLAEQFTPQPDPGLFSKVSLNSKVDKLRLVFSSSSLATGKRPFHAVGVGAVGNATVVSEPTFPEHEFFKPGRVFPIRIRHSNFNQVDDASIDIRGAALKFDDVDVAGPFDLLMATGAMAPYWNISSFEEYLNSRGSAEKTRAWLYNFPQNYYAYVDGCRRAPRSYSTLHYYSQHIFQFRGKDGVLRYVKYRMLPLDDAIESGLLSHEDQRSIWDPKRLPDEERAQNYLRQEFAERLKKGPINYKLQIQLHKFRQGDSEEIFNASRVWDPQNHPWKDLADVAITTLLPDHVTEKTSFALGNQPDSLGLVVPKTVQDYNSVPHILSRAVPASNTAVRIRAPNQEALEGRKQTYTVQVRTGKAKDAGTSGTIAASLTGPHRRTGPIRLNQTSFQPGKDANFEIEGGDVGEVLMLTLESPSGTLRSPWYLENVVVTDRRRGRRYEFPCHNWVQDKVTLRQGRASLPDFDTEVLSAQRDMETQQRRQTIKWKHDLLGLPGYIKAEKHEDLPKDLQIGTEKIRDLTRKLDRIEKGDFPDMVERMGMATLAEKLRGMGEWWNNLRIFQRALPSPPSRWKGIEDYERIMNTVCPTTPACIEDWASDAEFGRQFLQGVHPSVLQRCDKVPPYFPVPEEAVRRSMDVGKTLRQAVVAGNVYLADYAILDGVIANNVNNVPYFTTSPLALFYVNSAGDFLPIAIQLYQAPGPENPIWTPSDSESDWLLAKIFLRNADALVQQLQGHILKTHLVLEPFAVAAYRNLPACHPVHKLLIPHLRTTAAFNTILRERIIAEGSPLDKCSSLAGRSRLQMMAKAFKTFHLQSLNLPANLAEQGTDDAMKLPGYYYRDDGLKLWRATEKYVTDMLALYYRDDEAVREDEEVQLWICDSHDNGFNWEDNIDRGVPRMLTSLGDLCELVTIIIFTATTQRAAHANGQRDVYSFIPNAPWALMQPPPAIKRVSSDDDVAKVLPAKPASLRQAALADFISACGEGEVTLGNFPERRLTEEEAQEVIADLQLNLQRISEISRERNLTLKHPYTYLLPEKIPNAITP